MFTAWLIGALISGFSLGFVVHSIVKSRPRKAPKPLPPAGGQPKNRGEAVRRVLKHLQRKTIAELTEGSAAVIEGTVRAIASVPALTSPFAAKPCVGYHLDIRADWLDLVFDQLHEDARCTDFDLEDETGIVRVVGAGLEIAITDGPFTYWQTPPPQIASRLRPHHVGPITIEEGIVIPGEKILVCGVLTTELSATEYRDGKPVYTLRATPSFPLVASTDRDLFTPGERPLAPEELHKSRSL